MKVKYEKYWGNYENTNYLVYVATDPCLKMNFLQYYFTGLFGTNEAKVEDVLRQLFNEYSFSVVNNESSTPIMTHNSNTGESSPMIQRTSILKTLLMSRRKRFENQEAASDIGVSCKMRRKF